MITTTKPMHAIVDTFLGKPLTLHETAQEAAIYLPGEQAPESVRRAMQVLPVMVTIELAPNSQIATPAHVQPSLQLVA